MAAKLYLVRHGQIRANRTQRWHGSTDSRLTWTGRRQAARLARNMRRALPAIDAIYASPLKRCQGTARAMARRYDLELFTDDDLREYAIGELEDMPFRSLLEEHRFFDRIRSDPTYAPPGGESVVDVETRMVAALERIFERHYAAQHVVVVSHGMALAIAMASILDGDPMHWTNYSFANCSITELNFEPEPHIGLYNQLGPI